MMWGVFEGGAGWALIGSIAVSIGSFLGAVVYRLPIILDRHWRGEEGDTDTQANPLSLWWPPSHCDKCQKSLRWKHKIPLLSFIFLKGSCSYCKTSISRHYFYIEVVTLILWLCLFYVHGPSLAFLAAATATSILIALAFIDWRDGILPDELNSLLLWSGLLFNSFGVFASLSDALYGAVSAYAIFWLFQKSFAWIRGKEGLGQGDLKLFAAIGAWLGWQSLAGVALWGSVVGVVVGYASLRYQRQDLGQQIAMGPYLGLAAVAGLLFNEAVKNPLGFILGY